MSKTQLSRKAFKTLTKNLKNSDAINAELIDTYIEEFASLCTRWPIYLVKLAIDSCNHYDRSVRGSNYVKTNPITAVDSDCRNLDMWRKSLLKGQVYFRVDSVASSGMSRTLSIYTVDKGSIVVVNDDFLYKLAGCDKNGRIGGCGMDMTFASWHHMVSNLLPNHDYRKLPRHHTL